MSTTTRPALRPTDANAALSWDIFDDATIDEAGDFYTLVRIYDTPPEHTTVVMVGGRVDQMRTYDAATFVATGGHISSFGAFDSSTVNISGEAEIGGLGCYDWSTVNISGGTLGGADVSDHATLNLSGGIFRDVTLSDWSLFNMTGGQVRYIDVSDTAIVNLRGGIIQDGIVSRFVNDSVTINVYGTDLGKVSFGGQYGCGQVFGVYPDGTEFVIDLSKGYYSRVNLIPEPTAFVVLGLGALFSRVRRPR